MPPPVPKSPSRSRCPDRTYSPARCGSDCLTERPYQAREELARDVVRVLREELHFLLASGASLVQLDEPVLTEVVFGEPRGRRSFMCGALSEKLDSEVELDFAVGLLNEVVRGLPMERLGLHVCRGNWTRDESAALSGGYLPLLDVFKRVDVGVLFLELCTPRAGEPSVLRDLPDDVRVGVGVVNQKLDSVEPVEEIRRRISRAVDLFGQERVLLTPDCGFATFADNPVASAKTAEAKLKAIVDAREMFGHGIAGPIQPKVPIAHHVPFADNIAVGSGDTAQCAPVDCIRPEGMFQCR